MKPDILLIDKDRELSRRIKEQLSLEGFNVCCEHESKSAIKRAVNFSFSAIILDIMLPDINGFKVLKTIRSHCDTPVLMLSAKCDDVDRIVCLELGADDFLAKPCNPRELLARVQAMLRRTHKSPSQRPMIETGHISIDCAKRLAFLKNNPLELTNTEFNILEILMKSPSQAFSKEELTEYALGRKYTAYDRSIDVHISNLRNKLGNNADNEPMIKTVRGFGYMFSGA